MSLAEHLQERHSAINGTSSDANGNASSGTGSDATAAAVPANESDPHSEAVSGESTASPVANTSPEPQAVKAKSPLDATTLPRLPTRSGKAPVPPRWVDSVRPKKTEVFVLNSVPTDAASAVRDVQRLFGVQIEASKGGQAGPTTFLVRGSDAAKAVTELRARLGPKVKRQIRVPAQSRAAILGPKGQTLRAITGDTKARVELGQPHRLGPWDLRVLDVTIEGPEDGVETVIDQLTGRIDQEVTAARTVEGHITPFLPAVDGLHVRGTKVMVRGLWRDVVKGTETVDAAMARCDAEFVTRLVPDAQFLDKLPANVTRTEDGSFYGSAEAVDSLEKAAKEFLSRQESVKLDISRSHNHNVPHAQLLARLLEATGELEDLEKSLHVCIRRDDVVYTIVGDGGAVRTAKQALVARVNALSPSAVAVIGQVDQPLTRQAAGKALLSFEGPARAILGATELFIIYESDDDFGAKPEDSQVALKTAVAHFAPVSDLAGRIITRTVAVDVTYVRDPQGPEAIKLAAEVLDPSLVHWVQTESGIELSGPRNVVGRAAAELPHIVELSKAHKQRASFTDQLSFDPAHVRQLIGRSGQQVSKIREDFNVRIDVDDNGHVTLRGLENDVEAAKQHILGLQKRLRDEMRVVLRIPPEFHALLIGARGRNVRRLSERYGCVVRFPKDSPSSYKDASPAESEETLGEDGVEIRGPSKGVTGLRKELLDLVAYEKAQSFVQTVSVPVALLPRVIGRNGANVNALMDGVHIDIPPAKGETKDTKNKTDDKGDKTDGKVDGKPEKSDTIDKTNDKTDKPDATADSETVEITVSGERSRVNTTASKLQSMVDELQDHVEHELHIDPRYHRLLVGPGGSIRRQIVADSGGDPDNSRMLVIPPSGSASDRVRVSGPSKVVAAMETRIHAIVNSHHQIEFTIPQDRHRLLIGPSGSTRRASERQFNVQITVPNSGDMISVHGSSKESVEAARQHLLAIAASIEAAVPKSVESELWARGQLAQRFRPDARVIPARRPANPPIHSPPALGSNMAEGHAWTEKELEKSSEKVLWRIEASSPEKAQEVQREIEALAADLVAGYLWLAKPQYFRQLVGTGGATVNAVRSKTGCSITVPRADQQDLPVVLVGSRAQVTAAKQQLCAAVHFD